MKFSKTILGLLATVLVSGCTGLHDCYDDHANKIHTELTAMEAWGRWSWCYDELAHPKDFAHGFKAGYQDILNGGAGCQPTLPPRKYWSACYRTPEGHCAVNAWFDGFSHGVLAAQQDGAASYGHIPLSPTAQANIATAASPAPMYDFSGTSAAPAPSPYSGSTTTHPGYTSPAPEVLVPPTTAPANPNDPAPGRTYEGEAPPTPEAPMPGGDRPELETTSGRVVLPNLGG